MRFFIKPGHTFEFLAFESGLQYFTFCHAQCTSQKQNSTSPWVILVPLSFDLTLEKSLKAAAAYYKFDLIPGICSTPNECQSYGGKVGCCVKPVHVYFLAYDVRPVLAATFSDERDSLVPEQRA